VRKEPKKQKTPRKNPAAAAEVVNERLSSLNLWELLAKEKTDTLHIALACSFSSVSMLYQSNY